jgi:alanine-glyoxylate transaminase / serine-glyoxylate transaminase / serine-pyruvate transaminase
MTNFILPPKTIPLDELLPKKPLLLMGAGPVPIPEAVAKANSVIINHLGQTMNEVVDRVRAMARYAFQTKSQHIFGISGPASAGMEMAISSVLGPTKKVLVLNLGTFSNRFAEMARGVGAHVDEIINTHTPFTPEQVKEALSHKQYDAVTIVQGETSCGVKNIHLPAIAKLVHATSALMIVDAVCTLTTMELFMDEWLLDIVITGGQKGLSAIPGVSLVAFSDRAWEKVISRTTPSPHWCLDPVRAEKFWRYHQYHYTAPVPGILAMHEALRLICEETLEDRFKRHLESSQLLQKAIEAMGLKLFIPKAFRLNSVVAITTPEKLDAQQLLMHMASHFQVEISGAFGLNIVRIGQMGEQCRKENVLLVLNALGKSLKELGHDFDIAAGMALLHQNQLS